MASKPRLRSAPPAVAGELEQSVRESLGTLDLQPEDAGVRELALRYARTIDETVDAEGRAAMSDLGPKLLAALVELGATPKARAAAGQPPAPSSGSKLAALRGGTA